MARPLKNNADYFPHETGLRDDPKLKAVKRKYGLKGYAIYVMMLEALAESECLQIENTPIQCEILAGDFGVEVDEFQEILDYFQRLDLLQFGNWIRCRQLDKRLLPVFDKRKVSLQALREDTDNNGNVSDSETPQKPTGNPTETDIVKKSKEKKSRERGNSPSIRLQKIHEEVLGQPMRSLKTKEREQIATLDNDFGPDVVDACWRTFLENLKYFTNEAGSKSVGWFHHIFDAIREYQETGPEKPEDMLIGDWLEELKQEGKL